MCREGRYNQMKFSQVELPSNRKFGYFFTFVFAIFASYFYYHSSISWAYFFIVFSSIFLTVSIFNADLLLPLNKLWMRFGMLLGMIVSPIVLGLIFFGLFTPIALIMRISGRDELRLRLKKTSHWTKRKKDEQPATFKHQF